VLHNVETIAAYTPPPLPQWVNWRGGETAPPVRGLKIENSASPTTETKFITPAPDPAKQYMAEHAARHDVYRQLYTDRKNVPNARGPSPAGIFAVTASVSALIAQTSFENQLTT
jgi:hypothetical protein